MKFTLPTPDATNAVGGALAGLLQAGDTVALLGDLGAGKTSVASACVAVCCGAQATSPTFSLVNEYACAIGTLWHLDLYRLDAPHELAALGLDEIIGSRRGACLIEWADKFDLLPHNHLTLHLAHAATGRTLTIMGQAPRGSALAEALGKQLATLLG